MGVFDSSSPLSSPKGFIAAAYLSWMILIFSYLQQLLLAERRPSFVNGTTIAWKWGVFSSLWSSSLTIFSFPYSSSKNLILALSHSKNSPDDFSEFPKFVHLFRTKSVKGILQNLFLSLSLLCSLFFNSLWNSFAETNSFVTSIIRNVKFFHLRFSMRIGVFHPFSSFNMVS